MASSFPIGKQQHLSRHVAALSEPPPQSTVTSTTLHLTDFGSAACLLRFSGEIRGLDVEDNHGTSAHPYTKQVNGSMSCQAALRGGCDVDCGSTFGAHMLGALTEGAVLQSDVELVRNMQRLSVICLQKPTIYQARLRSNSKGKVNSKAFSAGGATRHEADAGARAAGRAPALGYARA
jgi:hypothetical protein